MAFVPILSFLVLLVFGSASSWAGCSESWSTLSGYGNGCGYCGSGDPCSACSVGSSGYNACVDYCSYRGLSNCLSLGGRCSSGDVRAGRVTCDTECEIDSVRCVRAGGSASWNSASCECLDVDTTYHCQNSGGAEFGGFGGPAKALLFRCITRNGEQICTQTKALAGTCQDWGFCSGNVSDCDVPKDANGDPPCRRSGPTFTTSSRCYYACMDGTDLSCKPISTGYVAGNIYAGECPPSAPTDCRPSGVSSSSGGSSSSSGGSSASGGSSGSGGSGSSTAPPADTLDFPNDGKDYEIDYSAILDAILDTIHNGNVQRKFLVELANNITFDVSSISDYSLYSYNSLEGINNKLTSFQDRVVPIASASSRSADALEQINEYLHSDSLLSKLPVDTVYNPLLRDIKGAIDSITFSASDSSFYARDSAFARWWSDYNQDTAARKGVLGEIYDNIIKNNRDSLKNVNCNGFNGCLAVYKDISYCKRAWGVSTVDCVDGGSPLDNMLNVEGSILSTLWEAIWGDDSTFVDTVSRLDTNVTFSPQKDTAESWLTRAFGSLLSPESTQSILQKVERMKDSVEQSRRDTVKIQPDSLWLDSSQAAAYVDNLLLPPGTVADCWVCHADLGTFGGLAPNGLSIHVDFSDFGGFNFCAIIRAVVKIAAFVICMSLTLGSWMAAFGYNPKNDA